MTEVAVKIFAVQHPPGFDSVFSGLEEVVEETILPLITDDDTTRHKGVAAVHIYSIRVQSTQPLPIRVEIDFDLNTNPILRQRIRAKVRDALRTYITASAYKVRLQKTNAAEDKVSDSLLEETAAVIGSFQVRVADPDEPNAVSAPLPNMSK